MVTLKPLHQFGAIFAGILQCASASYAQDAQIPGDIPCEEVEDSLNTAVSGFLLLSMVQVLADSDWRALTDAEQEERSERFVAPFIPYLKALNDRRIECGIPATAPFFGPKHVPPVRNGEDVGVPLTGSEKDRMRLAVQRCWDSPAGLRDAQDLRVVLAAELAADGEVISGSIRLIEPVPAPDARFQQAYEAGRRALLRCSPYSDLPREKFAQWRNIEVVFNPEGMVSW